MTVMHVHVYGYKIQTKGNTKDARVILPPPLPHPNCALGCLHYKIIYVYLFRTRSTHLLSCKNIPEYTFMES